MTPEQDIWARVGHALYGSLPVQELEPYLELFSRSWKVFDKILGRINFYKLNRFEMLEKLL